MSIDGKSLAQLSLYRELSATVLLIHTSLETSKFQTDQQCCLPYVR